MPGSKPDAPVVILIDLNGRTTKRFEASEFFCWAPGGLSMVVGSEQRLWAYVERWTVPLPTRLSSALLLDDDTLVGIAVRRDDTPEKEQPWRKLLVFGPTGHGKITRTVSLKAWSESELDEGDLYPAFLHSRPHSTRTFTIAYDTSNSTVRPLYTFALADSQSGQMKLLTEGQFLEWAPDGKRFCTAPGQDLAGYGKSVNGRQRQVWVAPLRIGNGTSGKFKNIVSGLVYVVGADWRG
jgi:hypothetical protein